MCLFVGIVFVYCDGLVFVCLVVDGEVERCFCFVYVCVVFVDCLFDVELGDLVCV